MLIQEQGKIGAITSNVTAITQNLEDNNAHISGTLANLHQLSDSLNQADVKRILDNAGIAVANMKEAMEKVNNGSGTMGKLINDSSLYINLNNSAKDLDLLMKDLNENPRRYVHFSVFGGKDKEDKLDK